MLTSMTTYFWSFAKSADNIYILLDLTTDNISWEIRINLFIMGIEATTESEKSSESHLQHWACSPSFSRLDSATDPVHHGARREH